MSISQFVFLIAFIIFFSFGSFLFAVTKVIGGVSLCFSIMQLVIMYFTPVSYIFSQERIIIKYFFGREENTTWGRVYSVIQMHESLYEFVFLEYWQLYYFPEKPKKNGIHTYGGRIIKNKKTTELMKKYCPKKID